MFRAIERYVDDTLGLSHPVTILDGVEEEIDEATGERVGISIRDYESLVASVAVVRALCPLELSGRDVRFIRRVLGMSASAFAEALTMDPSTLSRWEGDKQTVGAWADKQVRLIAVTALEDHVPEGFSGKTIIKMRPIKKGEREVELNIVMQHRSGLEVAPQGVSKDWCADEPQLLAA
ncbi:hypothetical protein [Asaia sp. HumB]|uniref:helix-turn-helix domain-containing protein n=1 Tax=Asaia sp. HumB TaxID=3035475 RepID=UPI0025537EE4|nr:hypothetical protein [Asaia sp. HumB]MDL2169777.1 hypothetical protein [Asaia sp. HumB]